MAQVIAIQRAFPMAALVACVIVSVGACLAALARHDFAWAAAAANLVAWAVFAGILRRPSGLALDDSGIVVRGHRVQWEEITSIEPPSAGGEIVLRLSRPVPGGGDWLSLDGTRYAVGPLGLYGLLIGVSREAAWLLGAADRE